MVLHDVFRSEIAGMTTGKNGKYSFKNIPDGLYFITATTNSDGMGYAVVVVRNGNVYGETDIAVYKSDKIKSHEDRFYIDVPECGNREDALKHRDRIAEEKQFYDGLSEKEKKQLSKDYVNRLDQLVQWITGCTVEAGDGVTMEQGGLVISGEEAARADSITFTLNVTPSEAHNANTDGVHDRNDQIHHNINDKANKHDVLQYYDITLSKEVDGVSTQITSVTKDTEANGKLRVTMEIPEQYRGYKHYTVIHEHCGDVVTLTDLDNDPNTVTFEVKKFSTFVLAGTNITLTEITDEESTLVESWGLTLSDGIEVNFRLSLSPQILADPDTFVEVTVGEQVTGIPAIEAAEGVQVTVAAAQMTEPIVLCVVDRNGNRGEQAIYTVKAYADYVLASTEAGHVAAQELVKAMLNYGGKAQSYFAWNTDAMADCDITVTEQEIPNAPETEMTVSGSVEGIQFYAASLLYRNQIAVRYYFDVTGDISSYTFAAAGQPLTPVQKDGRYYVEFPDIAPQNLSAAMTVTVTDSAGNALQVSYCPMHYIIRMYHGSAEDSLKALLQALYTYHKAAVHFIGA